MIGPELQLVTGYIRSEDGRETEVTVAVEIDEREVSFTLPPDVPLRTGDELNFLWSATVS